MMQTAFGTATNITLTICNPPKKTLSSRQLTPIHPWPKSKRRESVIQSRLKSRWQMTRIPPTPSTPRPKISTMVASTSSMHAQMLVSILTRLTALDTQLKRIKCPFWRRRFTDTTNTLSQIVRWAIRTRHKSLTLPTFLLPPLDKCNSHHAKLLELSISDRLNMIRDDFVKRQYYVTGRLSVPLYRDDCLFDGPDPDGRVRGVRKFVDAAGGLFDARMSKVELIDIYEEQIHDDINIENCEDVCVVAHWRLEGALMLPWRPRIKPYVGSTTYKFDKDGLIAEHVETWQISVVDAFLSVIFDGFGTAPAPPVDVLRRRRIDQGIQRWIDLNYSKISKDRSQ